MVNEQQNGRIAIKGEFNIYTAAEMKDTLLAALLTNEEIVLDLSEVEEFDAAGLQLLIMAKQGAKALGRVLKITGHTPAVLDILNLSGLTDFLSDPLLPQQSVDEGNET